VLDEVQGGIYLVATITLYLLSINGLVNGIGNSLEYTVSRSRMTGERKIETI
jgi:hypothetical protein